jgi:putative PEP-CTERM system TPR-repeat lipoprotein
MKPTKIIALSLLFALATGCSKKTPDEHFQSAQQYLNENNVQAAVIELKSAIQINPENGKYRLLLAEVAMSMGDVATADKEYEKAISNGIDLNVAAQSYLRAMFMARKHREMLKFIEDNKTLNEENTAIASVFKLLVELENENSDNAKPLLDQIAAQDKYADLASFAQAIILNDAGQPAEAIAKLKTIGTSTRIQPELLMANGRLQLGQRQFDEALKNFQEFEKIIPNYFPNQLFQAQALVEARKMTEAEAVVAKLLQATPEQPLVNYLSAVLVFEKKDYTKAKEYAEKAITNGFDTPSARILAGLASVNLKLNAQALAHFDRSREQIQKVPELARLYQALLLQTGRSEEIKAELLSKDPAANDPQLIAATAYQLMREGSDIEAKKLLSSYPKTQANEASLQIAALKLGIQGMESEGLADLEQALQQNPKADKAREVLAQSYLRSGQFAKAEALADYWINESKEADIGFNLKAYSALLQGKTEQAQSFIAQATKANAKNPFTYLLQAAIAESQKKFAEAERFYQDALAAEPGYLPAILPFYQLKKQQGKAAEAITTVEKLQSANPNLSSLRIGLSLIYGQEQQFQKVIDLIKADKTTAPPTEYRKLLIEAHNGLGNIAEVVNLTTEWYNENPENLEIAIAHSRALFVNKEQSKALAVLDRLLTKLPENQQLLKAKLAIQIQTNMPNDALVTLEKISVAQSDYPAFLQLKTQLLIQAQQLPKAKTLLEESYRKQPTDATATLLAEVYLRSQAKPLALALLKNHYSRYPEHSTTAIMYANVVLETDLALASSIYKGVLTEQSGDYVALNNYAWILHNAGESQQALKFATRALVVAPNQPDALDTFGSIHFKLGNTDEAIAAFQNSLKARPNHPEVLLNLVEALLKKGDKPAARQQLALVKDAQGPLKERLMALTTASQ